MAGTADEQIAAAAWTRLQATLNGRPVPRVVAVLGLRDSALLAALDRHAPGTRILTLEPDAARSLIQPDRRWQEWQRENRLTRLVDPEYHGSQDAWRLFPPGAASSIVLLQGDEAITPGHVRAARTLKRIVQDARANDDARRRFAPRYLQNSLRNIPAIVDGRDVRSLTNAYRGVPAVIAAAGPSLDAAIADLRELRHRALVIAVDTALRPLLAGGIAPDLVVGLDPGSANARHFLALPECRDTCLVAEGSLDPTAVAPFRDRTFWFRVSPHQPWPWLNGLGIDAGHLAVWGSVLTGAFEIACLAGCDPVALVGADLSYTSGRPYARGTTYEFDWALDAARGMTPEQIWRDQMECSRPIQAVDLYGHQTRSTAALVSIRDWMVERIRRSGRRVVNAGAGGILHGGTIELATLRSVLTQSICVQPPIALAPPQRSIDRGALAAALRETRTHLEQDAASGLTSAWQEFCGDRFDRAGLVTALGEAAHELEIGTVSRPAAALCWESLPQTSVAGLPAGLLESAARYRDIALSGSPADGEPPPVPVVTDERVLLLAAALDLLGRIQADLARRDDLPGRKPALERVSAAAAYDWPEPLAWAISIFEALLERTRAARGPSATSRFFALPARPRDRAAGSRGMGNACERPHAGEACALLASEWLEACADNVLDDAARDSVSRFAVLASLASSEEVLGDSSSGLLRFSANAHGTRACVDIPVRLDDARLGRVFTGAMRGEGAAPAALQALSIVTAPFRAALSVEPSDPAMAQRSFDDSAVHMCRPRVFPDTRVARSTIAYAQDEGIVCVTPNATASYLIRFDGRVERHHDWPRVILSELPLEVGGAFAWASGRADPANVVPPYVMYRGAASGEVAVEELPFQPAWATWWNGRAYFSYVPSAAHPHHGLASWAPGEGGRIELTDISLFACHPVAGELLLEPCTRGGDNRYVRRFITDGWTWHPDRGCDTRALSRYGAASSHAARDGWTATAYPESDLVRLARDDGKAVLLTVYYPFRVAWLGSSLLVSTTEHEMLVFEDILGCLGRARALAD